MTVLFIGLSLLLLIGCFVGVSFVFSSRVVKEQFRVPVIVAIILAVFIIWLGLYKVMLTDNDGSAKVDIEEKKYWKTASSGKVHNSKCRWYEKSKGEAVAAEPGDLDCSICGGSD